jgi:hypothetical protein
MKSVKRKPRAAAKPVKRSALLERTTLVNNPSLATNQRANQRLREKRGRAPAAQAGKIRDLTQLAERYRAPIRRDECGDQIIPGKRGHLYSDGDEICAMWTDARRMMRSTLAELGGKLWQGDISRDRRGRSVQDAWVRGILPDKIPLALRLIGAKRRRILSEARLEAQREVLVRARAARRLNQSLRQRPSEKAESPKPARGVAE